MRKTHEAKLVMLQELWGGISVIPIQTHMIFMKRFTDNYHICFTAGLFVRGMVGYLDGSFFLVSAKCGKFVEIFLNMGINKMYQRQPRQHQSQWVDLRIVS